MEPWTDGAPLILKTELPMTRELRGWTEAGSVYRCIAAILRRSLAGPPGSVYRCNASLAGPPASVYRCIAAILRRSLAVPPVGRCICVLLQSCADRSRGPAGSVYRCIAAILRRSLAGFPWVGVSVYCRPGSVYRCIAATLRRSLAKPPWVGVFSIFRSPARAHCCCWSRRSRGRLCNNRLRVFT